MRLLFIRHGRTEWNLEGRYQGRTDTAVCEAGLAEARRSAERLREAGVDLLVTSSLRRASMTADVIATALGGVPCLVDGRLIELDFGEWEGLTQSDIRARWPMSLKAWKRTPESVQFPGGESLFDGMNRLCGFLRNPPWLGKEEVRCVAVVSHSGPIRLACLLAERRPLAHFRRIAVDACAVHEFAWSAGEDLRPVDLQ
ncbi:MAG TPA: histidine phosphatase family protein [Steroidobacteraceae bacterium]|nr:histidine phosphatase family protein [Steroidobacteraceae bacterium]